MRLLTHARVDVGRVDVNGGVRRSISDDRRQHVVDYGTVVDARELIAEQQLRRAAVVWWRMRSAFGAAAASSSAIVSCTAFVPSSAGLGVLRRVHARWRQRKLRTTGRSTQTDGVCLSAVCVFCVPSTTWAFAAESVAIHCPPVSMTTASCSTL